MADFGENWPFLKMEDFFENSANVEKRKTNFILNLDPQNVATDYGASPIYAQSMPVHSGMKKLWGVCFALLFVS